MKIIKQAYSLILIALVSISGVQISIAQERNESFEKTYQLSSGGDLSFTCYETDLKVNTWNKSEVKIQGEIIIRGGDQKDQNELIEVFKNPDISESSGSLKIETHLAQSTIVIGPFKKITLVNGKTIRVDKYEVKYTLWVPEGINFNLKSKYNDIDIATLKGDVNFELYEVDLTLAGFKEGIFDMKYSHAEIGKGKTAKMDIYECEFEIKDVKKILANTKYSDYAIGTAEILAVSSYEDDFEIQNLNKGLTGHAKYSDFKIASNVTQIKMSVYESDIEAINVDKIDYSAKYSTLKTRNINSLKCKSMYEVKIFADVVEEFSCEESKYDNITFQKITKSVHLPSAYELDLEIQSVDTGFESFYGEFKYGTVDLPLESNIEFSLKFDAKYGNIDFPKNRLKIITMDFEDSQKKFYGQTTENALCKIEFKAYNTDFNLE